MYFLTGGLGQTIHHIIKKQEVRDENFFSDCFTLEDANDWSSRNVSNKLQIYAV
jgi:hypothetical protein